MKSVLQPRALRQVKPKVYDAFIRTCGNKKLANQAITWGESPKVSIAGEKAGLITIKHRTMCGFNPPDYFNRSSSVVLVANIRAWALENCSWQGDIEKNKMRFECTLLHEIVHFVRLKAGLNEADWDNFPDFPLEAGDQFEIWAYGRLTCTQNDIWDAMLSVRE